MSKNFLRFSQTLPRPGTSSKWRLLGLSPWRKCVTAACEVRTAGGHILTHLTLIAAHCTRYTTAFRASALFVLHFFFLCHKRARGRKKTQQEGSGDTMASSMASSIRALCAAYLDGRMRRKMQGYTFIKVDCGPFRVRSRQRRIFIEHPAAFQIEIIQPVSLGWPTDRATTQCKST